LTVFGDLVVFTSNSGVGLWQTDGTAANTQEITTAGSIGLSAAVVVNGSLLFNEAGDTYSIDGYAPDGATFVSSVPVVNQQGSNVPYDAVLCFLAGTRILTPRGEVPVEDLVPGDSVLTHEGETHAITWIGRRRVDCRDHPRPEAVQPVRIAAGAFGEATPRRDLYLSPDHAVFVDGELIPARLLIDGGSIRQVPATDVTYVHIELATHEILVADGLPAESYLDVGTRDNFETNGGVMHLFPTFSPVHDAPLAWESRARAPLRVAGDAVERARALVTSVAAGRGEAIARPKRHFAANR
jgi:hypothetical protein